MNEGERYGVENIVECYRPIEAEETLRLWKQMVKFQYRVDDILGVQMVLDRVHRFHPKESKPLGYLHFRDTGQLLELAKQALACACVLSLWERGRDVGDRVVRITVDGALDMIRNDVVRLVRVGLEEVGKRWSSSR